MDPEENYDLTESLVGGDNDAYPADISMGSNNRNTSPTTRCSGRIRSLPTLFFIVTPMIIFIIVVFLSAALIPTDVTSNSSKQAISLRDSMMQYLARHIMPYDVPNIASLGFQSNGQPKPDGMSDGIVDQTVYYSIQAKTLYPWTDSIPQDVYFEYVVPYAVTNEPRTNHRPLLFNALKDSLKQYERAAIGNSTQSTQDQIKEVVKLINTELWALMGRDSKPIVFKASQTPRIYDPLSVIAYGYSSCTGLAIMLVSALRSVGIPARMAGTPAWYGDPSKGDHSWVEVYVVSNETGKDGEWMFLEPTPGIAEGKEDTANADNLDRDPCKRWFCKADRFNGSTKTYATRYDKQATSFFPMAWADDDRGVPGEDRSKFYTSTCGKCK